MHTHGSRFLPPLGGPVEIRVGKAPGGGDERTWVLPGGGAAASGATLRQWAAAPNLPREVVPYFQQLASLLPRPVAEHTQAPCTALTLTDSHRRLSPENSQQVELIEHIVPLVLGAFADSGAEQYVVPDSDQLDTVTLRVLVASWQRYRARKATRLVLYWHQDWVQTMADPAHPYAYFRQHTLSHLARALDATVLPGTPTQSPRGGAVPLREAVEGLAQQNYEAVASYALHASQTSALSAQLLGIAFNSPTSAEASLEAFQRMAQSAPSTAVAVQALSAQAVSLVKRFTPPRLQAAEDAVRQGFRVLQRDAVAYPLEAGWLHNNLALIRTLESQQDRAAARAIEHELQAALHYGCVAVGHTAPDDALALIGNALANLSTLKQLTGDYASALAILETAFGTPPEHDERQHSHIYSYRRAILLQQLGRPAEAMAELTRALTACPATLWPHRDDIRWAMSEILRASQAPQAAALHEAGLAEACHVRSLWRAARHTAGLVASCVGPRATARDVERITVATSGHDAETITPAALRVLQNGLPRALRKLPPFCAEIALSATTPGFSRELLTRRFPFAMEMR